MADDERPKTLDELMPKILVLCPNAEPEQIQKGHLIIFTGLSVAEDGTLTDIPEM